VLIAAISAATATPSSQDILSDALTMEGLIFAAFSFSYTLAQPSDGGRHPFFARAYFGWLVCLAIAAVGIAAGAAWWGAFKPQTLHGVNAWLKAGGLAVGIVAPPIFSAIINVQARNS
jgi:hypothetical protein